MRSMIQITKPAPTNDLITVYEAKIALRIGTGDSTNDEMLELLISESSQEIATICNRVFAKETVVETLTGIPDNRDELFLARYPVSNINSVKANAATMTVNVDYSLEADTGRLVRLDSAWVEPVVVDYTGGYECPFEVPDDLRKAATMYAREAYYATVRGDQTVRMIGHKESRIIYFDPNAALRALGGGGGSGMAASPAQRAVRNLLNHYTRFAV